MTNLMDTFISDFLLPHLIGSKVKYKGNTIRKHTKRLEELGDISFPLNIKNWWQYLSNENKNEVLDILEYNCGHKDRKCNIEKLLTLSKTWSINFSHFKLIKDDLHLFFARAGLFEHGIKCCLVEAKKYGSVPIVFKNSVSLLKDCDSENHNLSRLRLDIVHKTVLNVLNFIQLECENEEISSFKLSLKSINPKNLILCGPVLNEKGVKDSFTTTDELYKKRISDMRMMAQHNYGVRVKETSHWIEYFENLGNGAVTIELLQNKPQKAIKISLNDVRCANKEAAFVFYNCARLAALFKKFKINVQNGVYPDMPDIEKIDFTLLSQPEEWELLYVYVVQFPIVIKSCVEDLEKKIINPHYLVSFLSNFSSIFSVYYRRVRILTDPRDHLFALLHARMYLLKSLEQVLHNALYLLNIKPVKEM